MNDLVLKLAKDVNENNYINIIIFIQKNKFDTNSSLIDQIINEEDKEKKASLINQMNTYTALDFDSSGYVDQLFSLFKNILYFRCPDRPGWRVGRDIRR